MSSAFDPVQQHASPNLWTPEIKQGIQVNHAGSGGGDYPAFHFTPSGGGGTHGIAWGGPTRPGAVDLPAVQTPHAGMY